MLSAKLSSVRIQRGVAGHQRRSSGLKRLRDEHVFDLGDGHEKVVDEVVFGDAHRERPAGLYIVLFSFFSLYIYSYSFPTSSAAMT